MLSWWLTREGFQILVAGDGREGIALVRSERPDLILMDLSLPVLDGWQATRRLKASPSTAPIPVTGRGIRETQARGAIVMLSP